MHVEAITYYATPSCTDLGSKIHKEPDIDSISAAYGKAIPGRSIGPAGTDATGTFSAYIRVIRAAGSSADVQSAGTSTDTTIYGLTCHPVAAAKDGPNPALPLSTRNGIAITSPSRADYEDYVSNLRDRLAVYESALVREEKNKWEMEQIGKTWTALREAQRQQSIANIQFYQHLLVHVPASWESDHLLGTIMSSSGLSTPKLGLGVNDWALIELGKPWLGRQPVMDMELVCNNSMALEYTRWSKSTDLLTHRSLLGSRCWSRSTLCRHVLPKQ